MTSTPYLTIQRGRGSRRWGVRLAALVALVLPLGAAVALGVLISTSSGTLVTSPTALATLGLPFGGATVSRVAATVGREQKDLPVKLVGDEVWPAGAVATGQPVTIVVTLRRPGWNAWLAGSDQRLRLTLTTPTAALRSSFVTVRRGEQAQLEYTAAVATFGVGRPGGAMRLQTLARPHRRFSVPTTAGVGTMEVAAAPRSWERPTVEMVSWFPAGAAATAVANPTPGTAIEPQSRITLTFSTPVTQALSGVMPTVTPAGIGAWRTLSSHSIEFVPGATGYGLGARVTVALPAGVHLVGGTGDPVGTWQVPAGSTTRLQQLLAGLGYLPVSFSAAGAAVPDTLADQEAAAVRAPAGRFAWRWSSTPAALKAQWQPGSYDELTKAAVMSFESASGLTSDGVAGPQVWKALLSAELGHQINLFGYSFVQVHSASQGETETTWHNGRTVASGPVNTGVAAAGGTQPGVFAVFEHLLSTTMTGVNPDGSHYNDPGIPDVSYFNGGDALHGFIRASYGYPQSDGCVEMPFSEAATVYPYTPVGTVVDVSAA